MMDGSLVPCMIGQLEIFKKKPVQACIKRRVVEKHKPLATGRGFPDVVEWVIPGRPLHLLNINATKVRVVAHMRVKSTGASLDPDDEKYSVADCTLHSLFDQAEIFLSEKSVTKSPQHYSYKSVLDLYSTAGADARNGPLSTVPVIPDENDASSSNVNTNPGFKKREVLFKGSKRVELIGKLRADVCNMEDGAYIVDNVSYRVRLTTNRPEFFLWSNAAAPDVELVVDDFELWTEYYVINPELGIGIDLALSKQPAQYHFKSSQIKVFIHPAGSQNIDVPVAFSGKLPSTVMTTFCKAENFNGDLKKNPYDFHHEGVTELSFFCNGEERRFLMNMDLEMGCSTVLHTLYSELGLEMEEAAGHAFTMPMMRKGRFACAVDLTIDHSGRGPSQNMDQYGTVRLQGRFSTAPATSICIIMYAQFDSTLEITSAREVSVY